VTVFPWRIFHGGDIYVTPCVVVRRARRRLTAVQWIIAAANMRTRILSHLSADSVL